MNGVIWFVRISKWTVQCGILQQMVYSWRPWNTVSKLRFKKYLNSEDPETFVKFCREKSVTNTKWIAEVSKWRFILICFGRPLLMKLHAINNWSRETCKRQLLIAAHKVACMFLMGKNTSYVNSRLLEERSVVRRISKFLFLWMVFTFQVHRRDGQMGHSSKML